MPKKDFKKLRTAQYDYNEDEFQERYNYGKPTKSNDNLGGGGNKKHINKYEEDDYAYSKKDVKSSEKKKGNSNVLNCVINLLKELSHNELMYNST